MKVLAWNIRASPGVQGITLPGMSTPLPVLSLYADDVSVITSSERAMEEVFNTYARFERGSGSKLNLDKCEGLWLGGWRGRPDSPVPFQWTSDKVKCLGTFIGNGNLEEANWRPRVDAVARCIATWNSRNISYTGRALISNALALARVWYMATMFPIPAWGFGEIESHHFSIFLKGQKRPGGPCRRNPASQPWWVWCPFCFLKSRALLLQWIRRFRMSSHGWRLFFAYWTKSFLHASPAEVLAFPFRFDFKRLPPFYAAVLDAWRAVDGHASTDLSHLFVGGPSAPVPVSEISCKSCYNLLLGANRRSPHCERKFLPTFGHLYWPATWKQVHLKPLDRPVIDLCWRVSHGVLYTAERLVGFGYNIVPNCFCGYPLETIEHFFFRVRLPRAVSRGPSLCFFGLRPWHPLWNRVIFCWVFRTMNFASFRGCSFIF